MEEEIESLRQEIGNLDTQIENSKKYTTHLYDTVIKLLGMIHKATNMQEFEIMKQELVQIKSELRV